MDLFTAINAHLPLSKRNKAFHSRMKKLILFSNCMCWQGEEDSCTMPPNMSLYLSTMNVSLLLTMLVLMGEWKSDQKIVELFKIYCELFPGSSNNTNGRNGAQSNKLHLMVTREKSIELVGNLLALVSHGVPGLFSSRHSHYPAMLTIKAAMIKLVIT